MHGERNSIERDPGVSKITSKNKIGTKYDKKPPIAANVTVKKKKFPE